MNAPSKPHELRAPDAARRFRDTLRLHQTVLTRDELWAKRFIAVRLADGGSDGVVYETRVAAILATKNSASRCMYFQIPMETLSVEACDSILWYCRRAYDLGHREDPNFQLIIPTRVEHLNQ